MALESQGPKIIVNVPKADFTQKIACEITHDFVKNQDEINDPQNDNSQADYDTIQEESEEWTSINYHV